MIRKTTIIIMITTAAALGLWDIYAYVYGGGEATISVLIAEAARAQSIVAVAFGILIGHWFWPLNLDKKKTCAKCGAQLEEKCLTEV